MYEVVSELQEGHFGRARQRYVMNDAQWKDEILINTYHFFLLQQIN